MKIIIVDDNKIFLEALSLLLTTKLGYSILGQYNSSTEFLKSTNIHKADCILIDIEMPELNGIKTTKKLLEKYSFIKIIAITNYTDTAHLEELITTGFKGCVFKNNLFKELPNAIKEVVNGGYAFPDNIKI